jgi:hypothetical protein
MPVELTGTQADLYETIRLGMEKTVREALQTKGLAKSQITILDALLKLRQVCCDPRLVPLESAAQKGQDLGQAGPADGAAARDAGRGAAHFAVLAVHQHAHADRGGAEARRDMPWVKLTGQSQKRDAIIEQFTSGEVPLFLISLKAGGVGLNLPQADTVIHYDPWWNPAVEAQATDRAHRIGQTRTVWVIKLVAQGTIEERILALAGAQSPAGRQHVQRSHRAQAAAVYGRGFGRIVEAAVGLSVGCYYCYSYLRLFYGG